MAMSVFLMERTSSTDLPFIHSVATEEEAMAEPQPKVLNLDCGCGGGGGSGGRGGGKRGGVRGGVRAENRSHKMLQEGD